jgi:membrane protease subunit (stomatin/prohibitin family)
MKRFAFALAATFVLSAVGAQATQQGQTALRGWKQMDNCTRQAQAAYPEFSADSNAKRDAKLKECLNAYGLPPRQPFAQPGSR